MNWKIASGSARGSSHKRSQRPNQDACEHGHGEPASNLSAVLAVSDGHGGARHFRSQIGSSLAAHTAVTFIQRFTVERLDRDPAFTLDEAAASEITRRIVEDWQSAVQSDFQGNPFTKEELEALRTSDGDTAVEAVSANPTVAYGATLLVAAAFRDRLLYLQLGDGDILTVGADGVTTHPVPHDERLIGNQTTSLCQQDAWKEFRLLIETDPARFPALVLISTDGYANSFRSKEDFLQIGKDYLGILREDGLDSLAEQLPGILAEASEKGSGDDITLGILQGDIFSAVAAPVPETKNATPANDASPAAPAPEKPTPARRHSSKVSSRFGLLVMAGSFLACAAVFQLSRAYLSGGTGGREPGSAMPVAGTPVEASSGAAGNVPPKGSSWMLDLGSGPAIPLRAGLAIPARQLLRGGKSDAGDAPYAEVIRGTHGGLMLTNRSGDTWTVLYHGKKDVEPPITTGNSIVLSDHASITFRAGTVGTILLGPVN